jgi:two-component system response regulator YesN
MEALFGKTTDYERGLTDPVHFSFHLQFDKVVAHKTLVLFINKILNQYKSRKKDEPAPDKLIAVKEYIHLNYADNLSLSDLADRFYVSKEYLANRFKHRFDTTVLNYIHSKRMEKACELLQREDILISQVAMLVGYDNFSYFNKVFHRTWGQTPSEFREKQLNRPNH